MPARQRHRVPKLISASSILVTRSTKAQARVRIPALGLDRFRAVFDLRVIGHRDQCARLAVVFFARSWMALIPQLRATPFAAVENAQTLSANMATAAGSSTQPQV